VPCDHFQHDCHLFATTTTGSGANPPRLRLHHRDARFYLTAKNCGLHADSSPCAHYAACCPHAVHSLSRATVPVATPPRLRLENRDSRKSLTLMKLQGTVWPNMDASPSPDPSAAAPWRDCGANALRPAATAAPSPPRLRWTLNWWQAHRQ